MSDNETVQNEQPFEACFVLDVGGSITADLTDLQIKRNITGDVREISWVSAPTGRSLQHLDLRHVVAVITERPPEWNRHE